MAEKPEEEMTEEQQQETFAAAFEDGAPGTTQQPVVATEAQPDTPAETPVEEVEYVQLPKKDYERMMAATAAAETMEAQFNKVFGTIGNVKNELLQKLQASAPAGAAVEITDDDFAELKEDFPELAGHTRAALERILKRVGVKGTGEATQTFDPKTLEPVVDARTHALQLEELDDMRPGWRDIVGDPKTKPEDAAKPFRVWLAAQPKEYQDKISNTQSAAITARAIDKFEADQKKAAEKPTAQSDPKPASPQTAIRKDRIEAAVAPRGTGVAPAKKPLTEEDHFQAGFSGG